jgi:hypothetical protein
MGKLISLIFHCVKSGIVTVTDFNPIEFLVATDYWIQHLSCTNDREEADFIFGLLLSLINYDDSQVTAILRIHYSRLCEETTSSSKAFGADSLAFQCYQALKSDLS